MDENKVESAAEVAEETPKKKKEKAPGKPKKARAPKAPKAPKEPKQPREKTPRSRAVNRILTAILTVLLIILALLVFVFRENLTENGLRELFDRSETTMLSGGAFTYETGSGQVFATAGNHLAVASSSAVQLLNPAGDTVFKQVVSYGSPAICPSEKKVLFYDVGGTGCIIADFDGESVDVYSGNKILTASMNASGSYVLVTEEAGYKGLVSVYNAEGKKLYEWWSGSGYVLKAEVNPDNKGLTVLTADMEGTRLHSFSLRSETEQAAILFENELVFDFYFMGETICALSESNVHFLDGSMKEKANYSFEGQYLTDYDFGSSNFAAFYVSAYRTGGSGVLLGLDSSGNVLGRADVTRDVLSMSASGRQLLVMTSGDVSIYNQDMVLQSAVEELMTAKRALLRPDGNVLMLSAYAAEKVKF